LSQYIIYTLIRFAGQESTSNNLTWAIAYLIDQEDIQQKLHAELDSVIGSARLICVADRQNLPFTNAVIMEIQRMANIVSQNMFRRASNDIEVDGFLIKKGTIVIPQISVFAIDPEVCYDRLS
jgi:cytochrome P450